MARRILTAEEEKRLAAEAEDARDRELPLKRAGVKVSEDATAVLSVRVPINQLRMLRSLAAERRVSLSTLLQDAIEQAVSNRGPRVSYSQRVSRLFVSGATAEQLGESGSETVRSPVDPVWTS